MTFGMGSQRAKATGPGVHHAAAPATAPRLQFFTPMGILPFIRRLPLAMHNAEHGNVTQLQTTGNFSLRNPFLV
jgi:hypothetical protein